MFDIGFSELLVIGIVALIVLGPERLPKVARTAGHLFGRMQRYVSQVKSEIEREMHNEEIMKTLKETRAAVTGAGEELAKQVTETEQAIRSAAEALPPSLEFVEEAKAADASAPENEAQLKLPLSPPAEKPDEPRA